MTIRGMIFDVDGTLVDTNPSHVEAWRRTFQRFGYDIPADRIVVEIGKGGDLLVPSVIGEEGEKRDGEALRKVQKEEFLEIARRQRFGVFPCVRELFDALRDRGIRTSQATSSNRKHLQATMRSVGWDLTELSDQLVTKEDADASKPAPDLVIEAVEKLGLAPGECAMVGDTIYDGQACRAAGVTFLGVLSGSAGEADLKEAGALKVWRDTGHLYSDLDQALRIAGRTTAAVSSQ